MSKEVITIPAIPEKKHRKSGVLRVAAYCRVSTDHEEQLGSFENQLEYYRRLIFRNPNYAYAGIYADEGLSATQVAHRKGFNDMIQSCDEGNIDLVITKSVSRIPPGESVPNLSRESLT